MTRHSTKFKAVAKMFEAKFKADYPSATINWTMAMRKNKDGSGGGRALTSADGFRTKTYYIFARADGRWFAT